MIPTFTTWGHLAGVSGNVLLIINSPDGEDGEVTRILDCLDARDAVVHVVAPLSWREFLNARGVEGERALFAVDAAGLHLELNYFLENVLSLEWIWSKEFRFIAGSAPHGLYNEEIKQIFEQRVCLFLRSSLFVAHTLPGQFVYLFDLPSMFTRLGRTEKVARYQAVSRELIGDCYRSWLQQGRPAPLDGMPGPDVREVLSRHLGGALLDFDERSPIDMPRPDVAAAAAATIVCELGERVREGEHQVEVVHDALKESQAINTRPVTVVVRDAAIEKIPFQRLKQWLRRLFQA